MEDETEGQNGEKMFRVTQLVTVRARVRPQGSQCSVQGFLPRCSWEQGASILEREGSFPRIFEMTIQLQSGLLWRPLRTLAETFLILLQAKFSSSYPWELTTQA